MVANSILKKGDDQTNLFVVRSAKRLDGDHPGKNEILQSMETDPDRVIRNVILGDRDRPILFMKQMAHHLVKIDRSFLRFVKNILPIRDPEDVLRTLINQIEFPTLRDVGIAGQLQLLQELQDPAIIDARELLKDPKTVLSKLCDRLEIPTIERNVSLSECHSADEVFTTGTMGELSPVLEIDGRQIGDGKIGDLTRRLQSLYASATANEGDTLSF